MDDFFIQLLCTIAAGLFGLAVLFTGIKIVEIKCFENVPVKCWVDKRLVYDGLSAGIDVKSTGDTTRVDITGGFFFMFPKENYVSHDVKLEGKKQ